MRTRVAIVTGSSRGIGKAIAFHLAVEGMNVVLNSRKEKEVKETAEEIRKATGTKALPITADIRFHEDVRRLIQITIKEFRQIDVLVNNAGVAVVKSLTETTDEEWNRVIDTNLKGMFFVVERCCHI